MISAVNTYDLGYEYISPPPIARGDELIALTLPGKTCLAILLFAVTLWVTEAMPFPVTSLLVLLLQLRRQRRGT